MKKGLILLLSILIVQVSFGQVDCSAQTLDCVINGFLPTISASKTLINSIAYVSAIGLGFKGILKLKEHNESKGQVKLSVGLLYLLASALLFGLPTVIKTGRATLGLSGGGSGVTTAY